MQILKVDTKDILSAWKVDFQPRVLCMWMCRYSMGKLLSHRNTHARMHARSRQYMRLSSFIHKTNDCIRGNCIIMHAHIWMGMTFTAHTRRERETQTHFHHLLHINDCNIALALCVYDLFDRKWIFTNALWMENRCNMQILCCVCACHNLYRND